MTRQRLSPPRPAPLQTDDVKAVAVGTGAWLLALLILLPFGSRLQAAGHGSWLWTCGIGVGLGLIGIVHCRRRAARSGRARHG